MSKVFAISRLIPTTVEIGNLKDANTFRSIAKEKGIRIEPHSDEQLLDKVKFSETKKLMPITVLRGSDLGFIKDTVPIGELRRKALSQGYSLCPAELALSLRLVYLNQPVDEMLVIAMESIEDNRAACYPYVFSVEHHTDTGEGDGGLWLSHIIAFDNGGGFFQILREVPFVFISNNK